MRVWSVQRTADQIKNNIYELNVETDSEGLLAYWKFDEGTGKTVNDYSGNGNTITSVNYMGWVSVSLPESKK